MENPNSLDEIKSSHPCSWYDGVNILIKQEISNHTIRENMEENMRLLWQPSSSAIPSGGRPITHAHLLQHVFGRRLFQTQNPFHFEVAASRNTLLPYLLS